MAIAEDMKKFTEDMIEANDMRLKSVGALKAETHATLKGFSSDRNRMAKDQTRELAGFINDLSRTVKGVLVGFRKNHEQMSKEQSKHLAGFVQDLVGDVTSTLSRFEKERKHMSKDLAQRLDQEIADIKAAVEQIFKDTSAFMKGRHSDMARARQAWRSMSAAIAKARKAGFSPPRAKAECKTRTTKQPIRKTRSRKSTATKSA